MAKLKASRGPANTSGNVKSRTNKKNPYRRVVRNVNYRYYPNGAVVYVGHVPHGFFEHEMRKYFSQFGTVGQIQLCRSKKTNNSKGYAFVEFQSKEVAEIAAEAMNNYLLFQKLMKCHVIPEERLHPNLFKNVRKKHFMLPHIRNLRIYKKPQTKDKLKKSALKTVRKKKKLVNKLAELGINYELPEEMLQNAFTLFKKRYKQNDVQNGETEIEEETVSAKRQRINSDENNSSSSSEQHIVQIMAKRKRKTRSASDEESGESDEEQHSVPLKKQKFIRPGIKQTSATHKQVPIKMKRTPRGETSAKENNLKKPRQLENRDVNDKPEDVKADSLSAKKQKLTSKTNKPSVKSPVTTAIKPPGIKKTPGMKMLPKKTPRQLESEGFTGEPEDVKDDSLVAQKQKLTSPKSDNAGLQIMSPVTLATKSAGIKKTPDLKLTAKKSPRQLENKGFMDESEDFKDNSLSAKKKKLTSQTDKSDMEIMSPATIATKTTRIKKTPDMKLTAKKTLRQIENENFKGKSVVMKDGSLSSEKRKMISPKTSSSGPEVHSPRTTTKNSPGSKKTPDTKKMTPKKIPTHLINQVSNGKSDGAAAKKMISPKTSRVDTEEHSLGTIATNSPEIKKTPEDTKMTPKKLVNEECNGKSESVVAKKMISPKTSRAGKEEHSPGPIATNSPGIKKTPDMKKVTPKKETSPADVKVKGTERNEDIGNISLAIEHQTPKNKKIVSLMNASLNKTLKTPEKEKGSETEVGIASEKLTTNVALMKTSATTPKRRRSIATPTTRVTRSSSKAFDVKTPKLGGSPLQKVKTPAKGASTPAKARIGSTKKKTM